MRTIVCLGLSAALFGCSDPPWAGSYTATSTWNISGPLAGGRTVGDAFTDLLVEKIVDVSPVPGFVEDEAMTLTAALIRDDVKSAVDQHAPPALQPNGALTLALGAALAAVEVKSTILLEGDEDDVEGTETLQDVGFELNGQRITLLPGDLIASGDVKLEAEWEGEEADGALLEIEPHGVPLHYGELVKKVALHVLDAAQLDQVEAGVLGAFDCSRMVADILDGATSLDFSVAGADISVSAGDLTSACTSVLGLIEGRVLGVFAVDSAVIVGGNISFADPDGDGAANTLAGNELSGFVNIGPEALAPRISARLSATRK